MDEGENKKVETSVSHPVFHYHSPKMPFLDFSPNCLLHDIFNTTDTLFICLCTVCISVL